MLTIILIISFASFLIASSFLLGTRFASSHISNQNRVSSASSKDMRSFETNSALLLAHSAARKFAAVLLPLLAICAAMVLPVNVFGNASASLKILTAKAFARFVISASFIKSIFFANLKKAIPIFSFFVFSFSFESAFGVAKPVTYEPATGAIKQPANFATANGIVNNANVATVAGKLYRDFYIYVDMRMSPSVKGIWASNPSVNNTFYYKDSTGAVKQTVSSTGATMAKYTDVNTYFDMIPWTDFEIKVIDKWGNNIYFSSTIYLNSQSVMNGHSEIIDSTPKIYYLSTRDSEDVNKCYGAKTAFTNFNTSIGATVGSTYIVSGVWLYPSIDSTATRSIPIYTGYDTSSGYKSVVWGEYLREIFTNPENLIIVWRQTTTTGETDAPAGYQYGRKRWIVVQPTFYGDFKLKN